MGRPERRLTEAQRAEVETLAAVLNAQQIADYFGIGRTTLFAIMERDPDIGERYKRGKAKAVGAIAHSLIQKARGGDTACMIFYLKCQAGWRERTEVEHSAGRRSEDDHLVEELRRLMFAAPEQPIRLAGDT